MLSVLAHLTSLAFVVWTAYSVVRISDGASEWYYFVIPALLGGMTALFFLMR